MHYTVKKDRCKNKAKLYGKPGYLYRGIFKCADCGRTITPEKHKGHVYYHCTESNGKHGAAWLREEDITRQLGLFFGRIKIPADVVKTIVDGLLELHQAKVKFHNNHINNLNTERSKTSAILDALYEDNLLGKIPEDR